MWASWGRGSVSPMMGGLQRLAGGTGLCLPQSLWLRNQQGEPSISEACEWERMLGGSLSLHQGGWFKGRTEEKAQLSADAPTSSLGP